MSYNISIQPPRVKIAAVAQPDLLYRLRCKHAVLIHSLRLITIHAFIAVCHVQEPIFLMMLLAHTASILHQIQNALNNVK